MPKAYAARRSTLDLIDRIRALDGVIRVLPFRHGRVTKVRVYLEPNGRSQDKVYTDFTLPEAREWLEAEQQPHAR